MAKRKSKWRNLVFVAAAIAAGLALSYKPWQAFSNQKEVRSNLLSEMKQSELRSEELVRQKAKAESTVGTEELARKNGFHRPGEQPIDP